MKTHSHAGSLGFPVRLFTRRTCGGGVGHCSQNTKVVSQPIYWSCTVILQESSACYVLNAGILRESRECYVMVFFRTPPTYTHEPQNQMPRATLAQLAERMAFNLLRVVGAQDTMWSRVRPPRVVFLVFNSWSNSWNLHPNQVKTAILAQLAERTACTISGKTP